MIDYILFWLAQVIAEAITIAFWIILFLCFFAYIDYKHRK